MMEKHGRCPKWNEGLIVGDRDILATPSAIWGVLIDYKTSAIQCTREVFD